MTRRIRRVAFGALATTCAFFVTSTGGAEPAPIEPGRVPALGRSVAGTDDSTALILNPANLAYAPGSELRWQGMYLGENLTVPWQGHAFTLALKLPFSFATAFRVDLINPPRDAFGTTGLSTNYEWLTWGLAYQASDALAFGASVQHAYSKGIVANSLGSYTLGLSARPTNALGLSFVASDVNGPLEGPSLGALAALGAPNVSLGPSLTTALAIRPVGTRAFEIGLEGRYLSEPQVWEPRATLGIDIPEVGRLRGEFTVDDPGAHDPSWLASLSLSIYSNASVGSTDVEGGAVTGTALGARGSYDFFNDVAIRTFREPTGLGAPRIAARIRIETTPDARAHVALLRKLWSLSEEHDVAAVVLELRTAPADSMAHVQELRDAVALLRARGKKVVCHLEDAPGAALYLCAAADRIVMSPAGGLRFAGLRTQHYYLADLLDNLGIKADFVRIGAHKSAPEQFTRTGPSDASRNDSVDLLQQNERWFTGDIAHDRGIPVNELRARFASGPFVASEAKAANLVDGLAFDDETDAVVDKLLGEPVKLIDADRATVAPERFGRQRGIALVYVDGDIIDGRSHTIPLIGTQLVGSYTMTETLKQVREDPLVGAVVLRIESPGGSSVASDAMWREVKLTAQVKPVIVSMGDVAASGGYYIASPATRILANPLTITGSIGVFYGKADISGLLRKIGVGVEVFKTAPRADAESLYRAFTDDERAELVRKVGQFYDIFLNRVADGRHMTEEAVDRIGQGRVWTGEQAKMNGLVDELGGLRQALGEARHLAGLGESAPIVELPTIHRSLLGRLLGIDGIHAGVEERLPAGVLNLARAMAPFLEESSDEPMSRLELAPIEP